MKKDFGIMCIIENKVRISKFEEVFKACFQEWKVIHNTDDENVGRIWVTWIHKCVMLLKYAIIDNTSLLRLV